MNSPSPALAAMLAFASSLAGTPAPVRAQMSMPGHDGAGYGSAAALTASSGADDHGDMMAAMDLMNREMAAPTNMTGNPDQDLVAMMIPHHQGAIDMARIYLRTGRDPQIRRMAQKIIADQEREIHDMRAWQARHPAMPH